jgi:hypothetical protein
LRVFLNSVASLDTRKALWANSAGSGARIQLTPGACFAITQKVIALLIVYLFDGGYVGCAMEESSGFA